MYDIYYAHHQWKYDTSTETYELNLIKRYFPNAVIFNPATDLCSVHRGYESTESKEEAIMEECLESVRNSDILIFSSLDGCIGTGVYHEVEEARKIGKLIFYIYQDALTTTFNITERYDLNKTDRMFAFVDHDFY